MTYKFTNRAGIVRAFENRNDYCRAIENQLRVEHLQDLNKDIVYEEMRQEVMPELVAEQELNFELELEER